MNHVDDLPGGASRLLGIVTAAALLTLGCATAGGPAPGTPTVPGSPRAGADARSIYRAAREQFDARNYEAARSLAERVIDDYDETEWLAPALMLGARASLELNVLDDAEARAARYLRLFRAEDPERVPALVLVAQIRALQGRVAEAADTLLSTPPELRDSREDAERLARRVASELGLKEIEATTERWPGMHPLQPIFHVERASLLLASGKPELARQVASSALALDPPDPDRERAERIAAGELERDRWRPLLGVVLPLSGALAPYGRLALEGVELAVDEYNRRHIDSVTVVVRDDADDHQRDAELVRELDELGAVAVIGPLRSEGLELAARHRRDDDLLLVSPTAPDDLSHERNVYSLWSTGERVSQSARALAAFAVRDLQLYRFGVLYPDTPEGRMQLAAFADEVRSWGAEITSSVAYSEAATTFQEPLAFLAEAQPQAIYAPASTPQNVIQIAPQVSFYGLRGVQVLGDAEWSAPEVLRLVEPRFINGTILSTFLHRSSPSVRWPEFVEAYERRYRKGLEDNLVPALAYDAANLVLDALPWGFPRRSAVARSFRELHSTPGATGVLAVEHGKVTRRPFILKISDRTFVPATVELQDDVIPARTGSSR